MRLQVKGRNVDVTDSLFGYAEKKLGKLSRHLSEESRCELELAVEHNPSIANAQVAEATVWTKGPVLRAKEASADMRASIDLLVDKVERQVSRYREKRRRGHRPDNGRTAASDRTQTDHKTNEEGGPVIVKTKQFILHPLSAEEAVEQLELVGHDFFVFRNAESDQINVVYRRNDGGYGLIEPA